MADTPLIPLRERVSFGKIPASISLPNLIEVQRKSYDRFLQLDVPVAGREDVGLQEVFRTIFPISDFRETATLEFVEYSIGEWEWPFDEEECQSRGMTYAVALRVTVRLVVWDKDPETGTKTIRDIKEQEVYLGDIPLMTNRGTFIINGTERVIVSQLHRSPGIFFHPGSGRTTYIAQVIPYRGSWVEFELDSRDLVQVRIDRRRKFPATVFLKALGLETPEEILRAFYRPVTLSLTAKSMKVGVGEGLIGCRFSNAVKGTKGKYKGKEILPAGSKLTKGTLRRMADGGPTKISLEVADLEGSYTIHDVADAESGEILVEANEELTPGVADRLMEAKAKMVEIFFPEASPGGIVISNTLRKESVSNRKEALVEIYRKMRPGDPPTAESSRNLFINMFENPQRYDLSRVGRLKFNHKMEDDKDLEDRLLDADDFVAVVRYLLSIPDDPRRVDDIDHLGNRRVRSVGELLENQFRIGLVRMERAVREKMSVHQEIETAMPHDLINAKPVMAAVREFFGSSQLSQFMDQTNPLSEITHKRRLSALGPGGLSRERAGFEVRDVHPTHYGRICPIETPEGPNIGLISSLSCYAQINEFGFIESPYRKVEDAKVKTHVVITEKNGTKFSVDDVVTLNVVEKENRRVVKLKKRGAEYELNPFFLSAIEEDRSTIAQANAPIDSKTGKFQRDRVTARVGGEFKLVPVEEVDYIDVSPKQVVSVAASLIPFLENDDANRALMGSNMQRQAVPLYKPEAPVVGTGMEFVTARDSGAVVICKRDGIVDSVDSERVIVRVNGKGDDVDADIYRLIKFKRSNQNTCINQKPLVAEGDSVVTGQVLADGPSTDAGELALGRNVLVAFMPWRGYNFEDAILVSQRLVKNDSFTSIHIEELDIEARDTKLGPEEVTRDIPNVSEEALKELDESGIVRIGTELHPGDILVGKVAPKGETQLTPEEKLLRAIFGEKAGDVKDASLTCPPGIEGTVVDVKVFTRKGVDKDPRAVEIEEAEIAVMERDLRDEIRIIRHGLANRVAKAAAGKTLTADVEDAESEEKLASSGDAISVELLETFPAAAFGQIRLAKKNQKVEKKIHVLISAADERVEALRANVEERKEARRVGDELRPGVIKTVKVYVAMKRKLSAGDKMAGRHGNKGVISEIVPEEDMPYLPDGTPVDIVLNPLGVPSRMNIGQVLETHLGWAAKALGMHFATPVFDGASEAEIKEQLAKAGLPEHGKTLLYDGMTGEPFENEITVGFLYMLKLSHLVDDKIHARSIGPYSLITQQPLGGKAQFGGQRFGEMEVWALEAYGAAHTLQELLTVKSDDVYGRAKIFESIVKGEGDIEPGLPESFNVLIKELQGLALDVELIRRRRADIEVETTV